MKQHATSHDRRLRVWRGAAWLCVARITVLSLVPHDMEVRTPAPAGVEHAIAYAGTAGLMVLGYPRHPVWLIAGLMAAYSGVMEVLQTLSPGRHPGFDGALWSSAGAMIGACHRRVVTELARRGWRIERSHQPEDE